MKRALLIVGLLVGCRGSEIPTSASTEPTETAGSDPDTGSPGSTVDTGGPTTPEPESLRESYGVGRTTARLTSPRFRLEVELGDGVGGQPRTSPRFSLTARASSVRPLPSAP